MVEVNSFLINPKTKKGGTPWNYWRLQNFFNYQRMNAKKNTLKNYKFVLSKFENYFGSFGSVKQ